MIELHYAVIVLAVLLVAAYQDGQRREFNILWSHIILFVGAVHHAIPVFHGSWLPIITFVIVLYASGIFLSFLSRRSFFTAGDAYIISSTAAAFSAFLPYLIPAVYFSVLGHILWHRHKTGEDTPAFLPWIWAGFTAGVIWLLLGAPLLAVP